MRVDLFDFELLEERIALRPAQPRDSSRLLAVPRSGPFDHRSVFDLPVMLRPGDALVVNDTRVIPARLRGVRHRQTAARVEIMLHRRTAPDTWLAFARPAKKLVPGDRIAFGQDVRPGDGEMPGFGATIVGRGERGEVSLLFDLAGAALDAAISQHGELPLPPYIAGRRETDDSDVCDYQTMFADEPGAVAAPTAGLHLTESLMERLTEAGIACHSVTLHVGAGTFLPVSADDTADHRMHAEWGRIGESTASALNDAKTSGGRIVAVGTTSLRLLESAADPDGRIAPFEGETDIFMTPGYRIRTADLLLTNFHLPRSTLFMLVSAFAGLDRMRSAYAEAIARGYRFYSYGDACLLERADRP